MVRGLAVLPSLQPWKRLRLSPAPCVEATVTVQDAPFDQPSVAGVVDGPGEHPDPDTVNAMPEGLLLICTASPASESVITQPSYQPRKPPDDSHDGEELLPASTIDGGASAIALSESVPV